METGYHAQVDPFAGARTLKTAVGYSTGATAYKLITAASGKELLVYGCKIILPTGPAAEGTVKVWFSAAGADPPAPAAGAAVEDSALIELFGCKDASGGLATSYVIPKRAPSTNHNVYVKASGTFGVYVVVEYVIV